MCAILLRCRREGYTRRDPAEWLTVPHEDVLHDTFGEEERSKLCSSLTYVFECSPSESRSSGNTHSSRHFNELMIYHTPTNWIVRRLSQRSPSHPSRFYRVLFAFHVYLSSIQGVRWRIESAFPFSYFSHCLDRHCYIITTATGWKKRVV